MNCIVKQISKTDIEPSWYKSDEAKEFCEKLLVAAHEIRVIGVYYETSRVVDVFLSEINGWGFSYKERSASEVHIFLPCIEVTHFSFQNNKSERIISEFLFGNAVIS